MGVLYGRRRDNGQGHVAKTNDPLNWSQGNISQHDPASHIHRSWHATGDLNSQSDRHYMDDKLQYGHPLRRLPLKSRLILKCVVVVLLASALLVPLAVKTSQAFAAGYGWDYISLPTWAGNCPAGGSVKTVFVVVGDTWSGGDSGDDLVYAKVILGQDQTVVGQGLCVNGSRSYWGPAFSQTIHPTRSNQTWWVGPGGVWHN